MSDDSQQSTQVPSNDEVWDPKFGPKPLPTFHGKGCICNQYSRPDCPAAQTAEGRARDERRKAARADLTSKERCDCCHGLPVDCEGACDCDCHKAPETPQEAECRRIAKEFHRLMMEQKPGSKVALKYAHQSEGALACLIHLKRIAHETSAVASFPALPIDPKTEATVDRLVADRLSNTVSVALTREPLMAKDPPAPCGCATVTNGLGGVSRIWCGQHWIERCSENGSEAL